MRDSHAERTCLAEALLREGGARRPTSGVSRESQDARERRLPDRHPACRSVTQAKPRRSIPLKNTRVSRGNGTCDPTHLDDVCVCEGGPA